MTSEPIARENVDISAFPITLSNLSEDVSGQYESLGQQESDAINLWVRRDGSLRKRMEFTATLLVRSETGTAPSVASETSVEPRCDRRGASHEGPSMS